MDNNHSNGEENIIEDEQEEDDGLDLLNGILQVINADPDAVEMEDSEFEQNNDSDFEDNEENEEGDREAVDFTSARTHSYMGEGETSNPTMPDYINPGTEIKILTFLINTIAAPTETVPLTLHDIEPSAIEKIKSGTVCLLQQKDDDFYGFYNIGCIASVDKVTEIDDGINLVCIGRQRCKVVNKVPRNTWLGGFFHTGTYSKEVIVQVLPDEELGRYCKDSCTVINKLGKDSKQIYLTELCANISPLVLYYGATENYVKHLRKWCLSWFSDEVIEKEINRGLNSFSYWLTRVVPINNELKREFLSENCVDLRLARQYLMTRKVHKLVCKGCNSDKALITDLITIIPDGLSSHFVNQHGYVHDMYTVKKVTNRAFQGSAETEYSWFPGYSWTIMRCDNIACSRHMGWLFRSKDKKPSYFYGLKRDAVTSITEDN